MWILSFYLKKKRSKLISCFSIPYRGILLPNSYPVCTNISFECSDVWLSTLMCWWASMCIQMGWAAYLMANVFTLKLAMVEFISLWAWLRFRSPWTVFLKLISVVDYAYFYFACTSPTLTLLWILAICLLSSVVLKLDFRHNWQ